MWVFAENVLSGFSTISPSCHSTLFWRVTAVGTGQNGRKDSFEEGRVRGTREEWLLSGAEVFSSSRQYLNRGCW